MDTRFYQSQMLDIERVAYDLEQIFIMQGYQVQRFGNSDHMVVQFKKGGDFAAIVGMQAALTLTLHRSSGGVMAVIGQQKWADKAAIGAVGMLIVWPLAFTAGAGMIRQSNLVNEVLNALDSVVRKQQANVQIGPAPDYLLQQIQQPAPLPAPQWASSPVQPPAPQQFTPPPPSPNPQWAPIPGQLPPPPPAYQQESKAPATIQCPQCHASNDADNLYCARCGTSLSAPPRCPQCNTPIKPDTAFCTNCGHSFSPPSQLSEATLAVDMTPQTQVVIPAPVNSTWGYLTLTNEQHIPLKFSRVTIGRVVSEAPGSKPDINLLDQPESATVSRQHALLEYKENHYLLTDLKSTNHTIVNDHMLSPETAVELKDGDTIQFGKVTCTFHISPL